MNIFNHVFSQKITRVSHNGLHSTQNPDLGISESALIFSKIKLQNQ